MPLNGPQIVELVDLLCALFSMTELERLVLASLNINLFEEYAAPNDSVSDAAFKLVKALERNNVTATLLAGVLKSRPLSKDFRAFCGRCAPELLAPPPAAAEQVAAVVAGVNDLRRRLAAPGVRGQVNASRADLEQIARLIPMMEQYKTLHDGLHTVLVRYYREVIEAARRFPPDPTAADTLDDYLVSLGTEAAKARATAEALPAGDARGQELRWVREFEVDVIKGLRAALDNGDVLLAKMAKVRFKSLLIIEPPRINQLLTVTANQLPLDRLIDTLARVAETAPDDASARPLRDGLAGLRQLYPRLIGQIARHTQWQRVDKELWQAEDTLYQNGPEALEEFSSFWAVSQADVKPLADLDPGSDWVTDLDRQGLNLDADLATKDAAKIRPAFRRYRVRAMARFFEIDLALKALCGEIVKLGEPVNILLKEALNGGN